MSYTQLSCGCRFPHSEDYEEVSVRYRDWNCDAIDGFSNVVAHASYCRECADNLRATEYWIETDEEEEAWLKAGDTPLPSEAKPSGPQ